ncbi:hypothetical protein ACL02O_09810 [Micromonospora sp. MS34]
MRVPPLDPAEVRGLDPYADPDELVKCLSALCDVTGAALTAVPGQR